MSEGLPSVRLNSMIWARFDVFAKEVGMPDHSFLVTAEVLERGNNLSGRCNTSTSNIASVICSTYNQPEWLAWTLLGFAVQDRHGFEVIIADDGSGDDTRALIEAMRPRLPYPVQHVWQPDCGFRKCRILNRAIIASRSDYLVFTDGDCIPRADFVSAHLRLRDKGRFLSGGYFKLPLPISLAIGEADIVSNRCFDLSWLRAHGLPRAMRNVRLAARGTTARWLDRIVTARASWNGHSASGWKSDLVAANGFDERMGYGGEDRELGERLANSGVSGKRIRHQATVLHLDHPRPYVSAERIAANRALREETRRNRVVCTPAGLSQLPVADAVAPQVMGWPTGTHPS